jgi:Glycosyl transferase family 2
VSRLGDSFRKGGIRGVTSSVASYVAWRAQGSPIDDPARADPSDRIDQLESAIGVTLMRDWYAIASPVDTPLVSIILPTRDRPGLVRKAVESVLKQSYQRWELLVIDDGEGSGPPDWLSDQRVEWLRSGRRGVGAARNMGLDRARGEIIVFLDDDNVMDQHWVKSAVIGFEANRDAEMVVGAQVVMPEQGQNGSPTVRFPSAFSWETLSQYNFVDMGMLAQRPDQQTRFDESLPAFVDWDYLVRLTKGREVALVPALSGIYFADAPGRISHGDRRSLQLELRARFESLGHAGSTPTDVGISAEDLAAITTLIRRKSEKASRTLGVLEMGEPRVSVALSEMSSPPAIDLVSSTGDDEAAPYGTNRFDLIFVDHDAHPVVTVKLLSEDGVVIGLDAHRIAYDNRYPGLVHQRRIGDALWAGSVGEPDLAKLFPAAALFKLGYDPPPPSTPPTRGA